MKLKSLFYIFCLFSTVFLSLGYTSDILDDYGRVGKEGWVWRSSFNALYNDMEIDFTSCHEFLSKIETEARGKEEQTNFLTLGFTFLIRNKEGTIEHYSADDMLPYKGEEGEKPVILYSGEPFQSRDIEFVKRKEQFLLYPLEDNSPSPHRTRQHIVKKIQEIKKAINKCSLNKDMTKDECINQLNKFLDEDISLDENNFYQDLYDSLKDRFRANISLPNVEKSYLGQVVNEIKAAKNFEEVGKKGYKSWDIFSKYLHSEQALQQYFKNNDFFQRKIEEFANTLIKSEKNIIGIILHLHSTRDICKRCAISLAEELANRKLWIQDMLAKCSVGVQEDEEMEQEADSRYHKENDIIFNIIFSSKKILSNRDSIEPTFEASRSLRRYAHGNDGRGALPMDLVDADCKKYFVCVPLPYTDPTYLINF